LSLAPAPFDLSTRVPPFQGGIREDNAEPVLIFIV
jgi:hypothetical protein